MIHQPVLTDEILKFFQPQPDSYLLDLTLGNGGHTKAFLSAAGPGAKAVGFDADPEALQVAREQLSDFGDQVTYLNANFSNLKDSLVGGGIVQIGESTLPINPPFTHILFDLGIGSHQLSDQARGFSFSSAGRLTMNYGPLKKLPPAKLEPLNQLKKYLGHYPDASDIIAGLAESDLAELLRVYGEERFAGRIAAALKKAQPPYTPAAIAQVIASAVPSRYDNRRINPATRTFQALRIGVNRELEALEQALPQALEVLSSQGLLAVISFHSLEDRIVKNFFRASRQEILTKKPVKAAGAEVKQNLRSRSARLRVIQKNP